MLCCGAAAPGNVAQPDPVVILQILQPVVSIQRMHLERRRTNQKPRPDEIRVHVMVAQNMANILAQETLDAFAEFLHPVHVFLLHPPTAIRRVRFPRLELPDRLLHFYSAPDPQSPPCSSIAPPVIGLPGADLVNHTRPAVPYAWTTLVLCQNLAASSVLSFACSQRRVHPTTLLTSTRIFRAKPPSFQFGQWI